MNLPRTENEIIDKISKHGIKPSLQRIQIYTFLCNNRIHPTAERVYSALAPSIPTLSKTTVYNTLKLFNQQHLIQSLTIENEELRYDANTSDHIHFKCESCGEIYDIENQQIVEFHKLLTNTLPKNYVAQKTQTFIWGICDCCKK
ncbi:MAG: transcriptional repressor [Spirochaetaceae bacterium]|nr:transcriptional repressor [Spirochaetaceae bacterium]